MRIRPLRLTDSLLTGPDPVGVAAINATPRESLHSRSALPEEVFFQKADCISQKALIYAPSGSVHWLLFTNKAWAQCLERMDWLPEARP